MATEITMPKLSDTMIEGVLIAWRKNVGQRIERGEILAEVETDKANMELESFSSGVLLETRAKPGDTVSVGAVIAVIGEEGEKPAAASQAKTTEKPGGEGAGKAPAPERREETEPSAGQAAPSSPAMETATGPTVEEAGKESDLREKTGLEALGEGVTAAAGEKMAPPEKGLEKEAASSTAGPEKAAPLVRRLAREKNVDLTQVKGTGPEGRILREDLERYLAGGEHLERETSPTKEVPSLQERRVPLSRMRGAIARKVVETWQNTPHFSVTVEMDMGEVERLYRGLKEAGHRLSLNDFIIKGCAEALQAFPSINSSFAEGEMLTRGTVDIGMVVALQEGLVIPVIRRCDKLSLLEIAAESHRLAELARSGKLTEEAMHGGTFTISNLGMYGVDEFFAVINAPESAILAVGAVMDKPCVRNGAVVPGRLMRATLSADHRLLDGALAAQFMAELKRILENPVEMLV